MVPTIAFHTWRALPQARGGRRRALRSEGDADGDGRPLQEAITVSARDEREERRSLARHLVAQRAGRRARVRHRGCEGARARRRALLRAPAARLCLAELPSRGTSYHSHLLLGHVRALHAREGAAGPSCDDEELGSPTRERNSTRGRTRWLADERVAPLAIVPAVAMR